MQADGFPNFELPFVTVDPPPIPPPSASRLLRAPVEIFGHIVKFILAPDFEAFRDHVKMCADLSCDQIEHVQYTMKWLNCISMSFRRALWDSHIALVCIRLGPWTVYPAVPSNLLLKNLAQTVSIEMAVGSIYPENLQAWTEFTTAAITLRRVTVDGCFYIGPDSNELEEQDRFLTKLNSLLRSEHHTQLSAMLLYLPFDAYTYLGRYSDRLTAVYVECARWTRPWPLPRPSTWSSLRALSLDFGFDEIGSTSFLAAVQASQFSRLEDLTVSYTDKVSSNLLIELFNKTRHSILRLTALQYDNIIWAVALPEFPKLVHLRCYFYSITQTLTRKQPMLQRLTLLGLSGYGRKDKMPSPDDTHRLDIELSRMKRANVPQLREIKLLHPLCSIFSSQKINISDVSVYSFWGSELPDNKIDFVDCTGRNILPNCWPKGVRRIPPEY